MDTNNRIRFDDEAVDGLGWTNVNDDEATGYATLAEAVAGIFTNTTNEESN